MFPSLAEIATARANLGSLVRETPVCEWRSTFLDSLLGKDTRTFLKLELFQVSGSFKPRGALTVMLAMSPDAIERGVAAVSAGNHAAAVGYAAAVIGTSAKVVMPKSANPARIALCSSYGAEVILVDNVHTAFERVREIEKEEGRTLVHPFEGPGTALGTATVGLELNSQLPELDYVVVPIGGGGLCAGIACAMKQSNPNCKVIGVEPFGADTMYRSFVKGTPATIEKVTTIADSLGAPYAAPYSFAICRKFVDELCRVEDDELCRAMYLLFSQMKLAVEPAGAAATAALLGPLRDKVGGKKVALIICGANIDPTSFSEYVQRGEAIMAVMPAMIENR